MKKFLSISALLSAIFLGGCSSDDSNVTPNGDQKEKVYRIEVTNTSDKLEDFEKNISLLFMSDQEKFSIIDYSQWKSTDNSVKGVYSFTRIDETTQAKEIYTSSGKSKLGSYSFGIIRTNVSSSEMKINVKVFGDNKFIKEKDFFIDKNTTVSANYVVEFGVE